MCSLMKIKHLILLTTTAVAASSLSSCKEEPYIITAEEEYTRNFIKEFGLIDPKQDWNLAEGSTVTVKVGSTPAEVKAYMKVDNTYYLVANLKDVAGDVKIPFDMPEGTKDIMVKINGKRYYTSPGGTVDPANPQSRELIEPGEGDVAQVSWVDYRLYTAAEIFPIIYPNNERWPDYTNGLGELRQNTYPDSDPRSHGIIPEKDPSNYDNPYIIMDFWFKNVDKNGLTIYPMYWNTTVSYHTIGIFYFVDEKGKYCAPGTEGATMVRQDIFYYKNHGSDKQLVDYDARSWSNMIEALSVEDINAAFNTNYSSIQDAKDALLTEQRNHPLNWGVWSAMSDENAQTLLNYLKKSKADKYNTAFELFVGFGNNQIQTYILEGGGFDDWNLVFDWETVDPQHTYASHGINIKVPSDLQFGFYLKRHKSEGPSDEYGYFYSITEYNCAAYQTEETAITTWTNDANGDKKMTNKPFAATYKHPASNNWFFSFEDAADATDEWDLNDLMFGVLGTFNVDEDDDRPGVDHSDVIDKGGDEGDDDNTNEVDEPYQWLLAVEDLGAKDDFDFNDIIIGITAEVVKNEGLSSDVRKVGDNPLSITEDGVSANCWNKVTFTALAAGGTLPAYVYFDSTPLYPDDQDGITEWHQWFGHSSGTMINTKYGGANNVKGKKCTIYFGTNDDKKFLFSLANLATDAKDSGFKIGINKAENTSPDEISDDYFTKGDDGYFIKPSNPGTAPQMFLIPDKWDDGGKWQWPIERAHIQSCYPDFQEWVQSKDSNTASNWYKNAKGNVCRPTAK